MPINQEIEKTQLAPEQKSQIYQMGRWISGPELAQYLYFPKRQYDNDTVVHSSSLQHWQKFLRESILPLPDDFTSVYLLYRQVLQFGDFSIDYGSWEKPKKRFSGDFVHAFHIGNMIFGVVADGATMLLKQNELPSQVQEICVVSHEGQSQFLPDHLWAAFAYQCYFGGEKMPIHPQIQTLISPFTENENIVSAETVVNTWFARNQNGDILQILFNQYQTNLRHFYSQTFSEELLQKTEAVSFLPSGVMAVFVLYPNGELEYIYTGDIDIYKVDSHGNAFKVSRELVTPHDQAADFVSRGDRKLMLKMAVERVPETGNLTGVAYNPGEKGSFAIAKSGGVVISTDGARLRWVETYLRQSRGVNLKHQGRRVDLGASLQYRNPYFYQMDLIREQRKWRKRAGDPYYQNQKEFRQEWRPDDATFLRIKNQ